MIRTYGSVKINSFGNLVTRIVAELVFLQKVIIEMSTE
jgi:hypothetical protein